MSEPLARTWREIAGGFLKGLAGAPLPAMLAGAVVGVARSRLGDLPGLRAALRLGA